MADRKPIVYVNGYPEQLADGDRLNSIGVVTVSGSAPSSPKTGDLWFDTGGNLLKVYDGSAWTEPSESLSTVIVSASAPSSPTNGLLWFDSTNKQLKIYVTASSAWESADNVAVAGSAPSSPAEGEYWWDTTNSRLKIYIGSADWMKRNLDRRVEAVTPIEDAKIKKEIKKVEGREKID